MAQRATRGRPPSARNPPPPGLPRPRPLACGDQWRHPKNNSHSPLFLPTTPPLSTLHPLHLRLVSGGRRLAGRIRAPWGQIHPLVASRDEPPRQSLLRQGACHGPTQIRVPRLLLGQAGSQRPRHHRALQCAHAGTDDNPSAPWPPHPLPLAVSVVLVAGGVSGLAFGQSDPGPSCLDPPSGAPPSMFGGGVQAVMAGDPGQIRRLLVAGQVHGWCAPSYCAPTSRCRLSSARGTSGCPRLRSGARVCAAWW